MDLNDRILQVLSYSKLSASEFADKMEVPRASISHYSSKRSKPSLDFIIKVNEHFPEIEWNWLLKGEGEMLKKQEEKKTDRSSTLSNLFTLIDDENFGIDESEQKQTIKQIETPRDFPIPMPSSTEKKIIDSQRLENISQKENSQPNEIQIDKIKKVILFYESGKFESFEPK